MTLHLDLSQLIQTPPVHPQGTYQILLAQVIPPFIKLLLEHTNGNKSAAARLAGFNRSTLDKKIKHYDIVLEKKVHLAKEAV